MTLRNSPQHSWKTMENTLSIQKGAGYFFPTCRFHKSQSKIYMFVEKIIIFSKYFSKYATVYESIFKKTYLIPHMFIGSQGLCKVPKIKQVIEGCLLFWLIDSEVSSCIFIRLFPVGLWWERTCGRRVIGSRNKQEAVTGQEHL